MDLIAFRDFCLSLPHTSEDTPFDERTLCFRVGGKIFAITDIEEQPFSVNLKCNPDRAVSLREKYPNIKPGYHMNKVHWNTIDVVPGFPDSLFFELAQHSYDLIFASLTKKQREALKP